MFNNYLKKVKPLILPLATIVVVLILLAKFLLPKIGDIQAVLLSAQKIDQELTTFELKSQKLQGLANSSLKADYQQLEAVLPAEKNITLIFSTLEGLEQKNNVTIEGLNVKPGLISNNQDNKKPKTGPENLTFTFIVTGTENSVNQFLEDLTVTTPIFLINKVNLAMTASVVTANVDLSTYIQPLPTSLGKIETPLPELSAAQKKTLETLKSYKAVNTSVEQLSENAGSSQSAAPLKKGIFEL